MSDISPLPRSATAAAAATLARAFDADPMFSWLFPDSATRPAALERLLRVPLEFGCRWGRITVSHGIKAVSVWSPPGSALTVPRLLRSGMLGVPFSTGFGPFATFMRANDVMEKIHKARMPEPHWYLIVIGVEPDLQGQGVGSALVRHGLAEADRHGHPCYLETSDLRNVAFYERHGFVVQEEAALGAGGPPAWAMRRAVRPVG